MLKQSHNLKFTCNVDILTPLFSFVKLPDPHPSLTHTSAVNPSQYRKQWLLSSKADKTTIRTVTGGIRTRLRINPETAGPDKQAQMLKMISALEELHRTFNSTLRSRITIMPRGIDTLMYTHSFLDCQVSLYLYLTDDRPTVLYLSLKPVLFLITANGRNSGRKNKVVSS